MSVVEYVLGVDGAAVMHVDDGRRPVGEVRPRGDAGLGRREDGGRAGMGGGGDAAGAVLQVGAVLDRHADPKQGYIELNTYTRPGAQLRRNSLEKEIASIHPLDINARLKRTAFDVQSCPCNLTPSRSGIKERVRTTSAR